MIPASIKNVTYLIAAILGITYDMAVAFGMLLIIDFITGISASISTKGLRSLSSATAWRGVFAKVMLVLALCSISLMAKVLDEDMGFLIKSCMGILAVAETYSIWANIYMVRTGKVIEEIDAITPIMDKFKKIFDAIVLK